MRKFVQGHLRILLAVVAVAGIAWAAWSQREAVSAIDFGSDPAGLALALGLLAVAPLLQAITFVLGLRATGAPAEPAPALRMWSRSYLLRYEPSGALGFVHRVAARGRVGASTAQVLTVSAYEQLAAVVAGAIATVAAFLAAGIKPPVLAIALFAGALVVALLARPALAAGWLQRRLHERGIEMAAPLRGRALAAMVAIDAVGWVATGLGVWTLVRALEITGGLDAFLLLGAFALSWLIGVLVPLAPGGLGLRDGALVGALAAVIGGGPATALALVLRLATFAGELLAAALAELTALALGRRTAPPATAAEPPLPEPDRRGTIVVVPTYQEAAALPRFVERFAATGLELLIVDDASPDGTGALADELAAQRPWMHVLHRAGKDGLGVAYRAGFAWCLGRGYRAIGQMDCDLSHPPEKLREMLAVLEARDADLVLGNRYMRGGGTSGWSAARRTLSRVGCAGSKLILGLPFDDLSGGFKLWRASTLAELGLEDMLAAGYAFQVETTQLAYLMGKRIEEVPFVFSERVAGESKMSLAVSLEGIRLMFALRRRARAVRFAATRQ